MRLELQELAMQLHSAGAVRLGDIEACAGRRTPIYFDLRVVISHPTLMKALAKQLQQLSEAIPHDLICGVPYAALPFAVAMSITTGVPMLMKRKEAKLHGTKKILEGVFNPGQNCLVVEDVVTSGGSLLETIQTLRSEGLKVTHAVVVLDREQGGVGVLKQNGVDVKALFTMSELVEILKNTGKLSEEMVEIILEHIKECQFGVKDNME